MNPYLSVFAAAMVPVAAMLWYAWEDEDKRTQRVEREMNFTPPAAGQPRNSAKDQQLLAFIFARRHETDMTKVFLEHERRPVSEDPDVRRAMMDAAAANTAAGPSPPRPGH